jgi:hypothetical protein
VETVVKRKLLSARGAPQNQFYGLHWLIPYFSDILKFFEIWKASSLELNEYFYDPTTQRWMLSSLSKARQRKVGQAGRDPGQQQLRVVSSTSGWSATLPHLFLMDAKLDHYKSDQLAATFSLNLSMSLECYSTE